MHVSSTKQINGKTCNILFMHHHAKYVMKFCFSLHFSNNFVANYHPPAFSINSEPFASQITDSLFNLILLRNKTWHKTARYANDVSRIVQNLSIRKHLPALSDLCVMYFKLPMTLPIVLSAFHLKHQR